MKYPLTALASLVAVRAGGAAAPQGTTNSAPTAKDVMTTMTIPASDAIFAAGTEPPKETAQWLAPRASAKTLADSGRVLTTIPRAKDNAEWTEMARALVTNAERTLKAIDAMDADALSNAGDEMYVTCKACHDRFVGP